MSDCPEEYPALGVTLITKAKSKGGTDPAKWKGPTQPGALGVSSSSGQQQPVEAGDLASHSRRGPPELPRVPEKLVERKPGETDQEYKCRIVRERYLMVTGTTREDEDMVGFFNQTVSADSRGVISSFITSVIISRHWGKNHLDTDTSITTIAKTLRELTSWVHPDHVPEFSKRSKDHHDLLHNGYLVITMAVANLKTILRSGRTVGGVVASMQFPQEQKEYLLRPTVASYPSVWDTVEKQASQSTPICVRPVNVLPETRRIETRSKSGWKYKHAPPYNLVVPAAYPEALNMNLPEHSWAQALQLALHSLRLAFHNVAGYAPI